MKIMHGLPENDLEPITTDMFLQYGKLKYHLRKIFEDLVDIWPASYLAITDIWRLKENDSGVHELYRGVDIRVTNLGASFQFTADDLSSQLNSRWIYDPSRPSKLVAYSKPHGSGPHIHLQSHPSTGKRIKNA